MIWALLWIFVIQPLIIYCLVAGLVWLIFPHKAKGRSRH